MKSVGVVLRRACRVGRGAVAAVVALLGLLSAWADGEKRPMALMVMFDGLRADGIESGYMPNVEKLRNGTWQKGYKAAWTVSAQITPGAVPSSAPNHASIATGYGPSRNRSHAEKEKIWTIDLGKWGG